MNSRTRTKGQRWERSEDEVHRNVPPPWGAQVDLFKAESFGLAHDNTFILMGGKP